MLTEKPPLRTPFWRERIKYRKSLVNPTRCSFCNRHPGHALLPDPVIKRRISRTFKHRMPKCKADRPEDLGHALSRLPPELEGRGEAGVLQVRERLLLLGVDDHRTVPGRQQRHDEAIGAVLGLVHLA